MGVAALVRRLPERGRPRAPVSTPALARRRSRGYSRPRLGRSTSKQRDACRDQPDRQRDHRQEDDAEQQGDAADKAEVCQPACRTAVRMVAIEVATISANAPNIPPSRIEPKPI